MGKRQHQTLVKARLIIILQSADLSVDQTFNKIIGSDQGDQGGISKRDVPTDRPNGQSVL